MNIKQKHTQASQELLGLESLFITSCVFKRLATADLARDYKPDAIIVVSLIGEILIKIAKYTPCI